MFIVLLKVLVLALVLTGGVLATTIRSANGLHTDTWRGVGHLVVEWYRDNPSEMTKVITAIFVGLVFIVGISAAVI